jgi:UDP-glucose 4-epimerase
VPVRYRARSVVRHPDQNGPTMKVVVTGGAGFIGANLCRQLGSVPGIDQVVALDDLSTGHRDNLSSVKDVDLVEGSILDPGLLDRVFSGAGAVVHLAARPSVPRSLADPMASHTTNATGTMEVLEAARRNGRPQVVLASSSSVYGANPALPKREDMATMPASPYAASKLAAESATLAYGRSFGLPVLAFRFFNVFGPLQDAGHAYAAVVPAFVDAALRGQSLPVHGDGTQTRDFTYVDTVCRVLADTVVRQVTDPDPVNLAFGTRVSLLEVIGLLEEILGRPLERTYGDTRPGDVRDSQADGSRISSLFPDLTPVALEDGLRATVEWFRTVL